MAGPSRRARTGRTQIPRAALLLGTVGLLAGVVEATSSAPASGTPQLAPPDLQILVPPGDISIGTAAGGDRQLQFTHITWDAGGGPFLITPKPNRATGLSSFTQTIYVTPSPGRFRPRFKVPLAVPGVFSGGTDYRYPLTRFTLDAANPNGSPGALVAVSPKTDYCITADAFVGGVPHTPNHTSPPQRHCGNPRATLGFSIGWGDQYDQTDDGQPIDLTGVPDGTYVLRATVDPQHIFTETDRTNDVVDTVLQISGDTVTVLGQSMPKVVPPTVSVTAPAAGSSISGNVTLQAAPVASGPATVSSVQFLLDGLPLGAAVTASPWQLPWNTISTTLGVHTIGAQVTDSDGTVGTASPVTVRVVAGGSSGLSLDASATKTGKGTLSVTGLSTVGSGDTLLAFVSADGPAGAGQQAALVSSPNLTWHSLIRENQQSGDAEIWSATPTGALSNASVSAQFFASGYDGQLTVLAFRNSAGTGALSASAGPSGAPSTSLVTTAAGSMSFAVGADWDTATARTVGSGQTMLQQWVDTGGGDTFWVQGTASPSSSAGDAVTLADAAPTTDQWDVAAVEVKPAVGGAALPVVHLATTPLAGTVSGTAHLVASVDTAVQSVQFLVDGQPAGAPVTAAPFAAPLDTAALADGAHTVSAVVSTPSGQVARAEDVPMTTLNPAPPMTCFVLQTQVGAHGTGSVVTPPVHGASSDQTLVAFDTASGPGAGQVTVRGGGVRWHLVRRAHSAAGAVAVWSAHASHVLVGARVTASAGPKVRQRITVIAMEGVDGVGSSSAGSGSGGDATVHLTTRRGTSLVFAVGMRAGARPGPLDRGWVPLASAGNARGGSWTQYTNVPTGAAGTPVDVHGSGPAASPWSMVAVELVNDGE